MLELSKELTWDWSLAAPWDPELIYEFRYEEPEICQPFPLKWEEPLKGALHRHLTHLLHLATYCGFQNSWARLAENWHQEGIPMNRAWLGAAMGGELAMAGIYDITRTVLGLGEVPQLSISPLHFWAIMESCRWMRFDFIPQCEESGGLTFGSREEIEADLIIVEKRFSAIDEVLEGEFDPYARIRLCPPIP